MSFPTERLPMQPVWVMCGVVLRPDVVTLFASKHLTRAELESIATDSYLIYNAGTPEPGFAYRDGYVLTTEMDRFVMIEAPDWQTAFHRLFTQWKPDDESLELEGRTQITR